MVEQQTIGNVTSLTEVRSAAHKLHHHSVGQIRPRWLIVSSYTQEIKHAFVVQRRETAANVLAWRGALSSGGHKIVGRVVKPYHATGAGFSDSHENL